jgi:hypothetical protein
MIFLANNDKTEQPFRIREEVMLGSYKIFVTEAPGPIGLVLVRRSINCKGYDANFSSK